MATIVLTVSVEFGNAKCHRREFLRKDFHWRFRCQCVVGSKKVDE